MLRNEIVSKLKQISGSNDIKIDTPSILSHGDYATSLALTLSKRQKRSPIELAEEIVEKLKSDADFSANFKKIEVAHPGFINFFVSDNYLKENLDNIDSTYGQMDAYKGKRIMVEFAHPNTHKELHIGHMRTLTVGESLARIFEAAGAEVFRANYQGDIGPHVAKSIWGLQKNLEKAGKTLDEVDREWNLAQKAHELGDGYILGNSEYAEKKEEIDALNKALYASDPGVMPIYEKTRQWSLDYYNQFYVQFGTKFDKLYFESQVAQVGKRIVLENVGRVFEESEGAIIFDGEKYGLHKRVFVTKDGNPTYEGKEISLAQKQFSDFEFDQAVHVVASEQKGYFEVVIKAIEEVFPSLKGREYHLSMGMVQLVDRKMSSRTGEILRVDDLITDIKSEVMKYVKNDALSEKEKEDIVEKVAMAALKYSVLNTSATQNVAFDIEKSVSFEGNSGPYLQYTYARTKSILGKSSGVGVGQVGGKLNPEEDELIRILSHFSETIVDAANLYSPNTLCTYLFSLAQSFNSFYAKHKVIGGENETLRLKLVSTTAVTIKNGLNLLGIEAPEKM